MIVVSGRERDEGIVVKGVVWEDEIVLRVKGGRLIVVKSGEGKWELF